MNETIRKSPRAQLHMTEKSADGKLLRLRSGQVVTLSEYKQMARLRLMRLQWWRASTPLRHLAIWLAEHLPKETHG